MEFISDVKHKSFTKTLLESNMILTSVGVGDGSAVTMSTQYEHKSFCPINQQNKAYIPKQLQPLNG